MKEFLTLSAQQASTDAYANSVDPDEMAHNEPSHQDLHCLPFCFSVYIEMPIFNNGPVQIQSRKRPHQELRGERVNMKFIVWIVGFEWEGAVYLLMYASDTVLVCLS